MVLNVLLLGKCEYGQALQIQYKLLEKRQRGEIGDTLVLVEHDPVITMGRNADRANVKASGRQLEDDGISLYEANRGGDVTYHGYGQIVGYPIVDLKSRGKGIRDFVSTLEEIFIRLLKEKHDVEAGRDDEHTGVWVGRDKIVAIGLAVKRGVTMHGFAFNVSTNLDHFNYIVPCGIKDRGVTSLQKLKGWEYHDAENEVGSVIGYFCSLFSYDGYRVMSLKEINLEV